MGNAFGIIFRKRTLQMSAGAGIEWAFAPNWTAKIEYDFLGLNNSSLTVPVGTPIIGGDVITITNRDAQTLTVGINYLSIGIKASCTGCAPAALMFSGCSTD